MINLTQKRVTKIKMLSSRIFSLSLPSILNYAFYKMLPHRSTINPSWVSPVACTIFSTSRCNLKCSFCLAPKITDSKDWQKFEITEEKVKNILGHPIIRRALYIHLTGGEPLMLEELQQILSLIRRSKRFCGLVTNGILLEDRINEISNCGIDNLTVSVYDTNITKLVDILPKSNEKIRCRTNKVLLRSELENNPIGIEEVIRMSIETNCRGLYLSDYLPHGTDDLDEIIYDDNQAYIDFKKRIAEKYKGFFIHWLTPMKKKIRFRDKVCRQPWYQVMVDAQGNMGLCCNFVPSDKKTFGNLFDKDYSMTLNTPQRIRMREELLAYTPEIPVECRGCNILSDKWLADM